MHHFGSIIQGYKQYWHVWVINMNYADKYVENMVNVGYHSLNRDEMKSAFEEYFNEYLDNYLTSASDLKSSSKLDNMFTKLPSFVLEKYQPYKPSCLEIKEILLALFSGHCMTFQDLQEHPEEIIDTISNFLILLQKKFV